MLSSGMRPPRDPATLRHLAPTLDFAHFPVVHMHKTLVRSIVPFVVLLAACNDGPSVPGADLTEAERQLAVSFLFDQAVVGFVSDPLPQAPAQSGPQPAPQTIMVNDTTVIDCTVSGTVRRVLDVDGTVDDETSAADLMVAIEQDHDACVERSDDGAIELQFDGNPSLLASFDMISDAGGDLEIVGSIAGTLTVTTESTSVACLLQMNFSGSGTVDEGLEFGLVGSFCGGDFQASFNTGA